MRIKYIGKATVRIIGKYRWDKGNGYVQDVTDPKLAAELRTYPKRQFVFIETPERVQRFVLRGLGMAQPEEKPKRRRGIRLGGSDE